MHLGEPTRSRDDAAGQIEGLEQELRDVQQVGANLLQERDALAADKAELDGRLTDLTSAQEKLQ